MVQVAGLGAGACYPPNVGGPVASRERLHLRAVAVVEEGDPDPGATHPHGSRDSGLHHVDRLTVDGHEDVDVDHLSRPDGPAPGSLVGTGPPEAGSLDQVEQLGNDQHAVEGAVADALRCQEPAEVPERQWRVDNQQEPDPSAGRTSEPLGLAADVEQPRVVGRWIHWNSQTSTFGRRNSPAGRPCSESWWSAFPISAAEFGSSRKLPTTKTRCPYCGRLRPALS